MARIPSVTIKLFEKYFGNERNGFSFFKFLFNFPAAAIITLDPSLRVLLL